ncbi:Golgi phosphoprotein 3-domain-containing protein [Sporodiniella umbellata]|nr:Golgi phosphoprotein 3-domain-containing protein [Sporodiniella umbellata]
MSTVTRRRVAGQSSNLEDDENNNKQYNRNSNEDKKIARDPHDIDETKSSPKLTLMEEVLLLGLKDKQGYLSFWNDSISYALRGCIVIELALRGRVAVKKDPMRRSYPISDRHIEVINDHITGEVLLDEALKMMKTSEPMSINGWIDLMSGETWNVMKIGYQLKQVRERLAKGLVDKGVLRTEKRNFLLFDMATHPVADPAVKEEVIKRVCTMLITRVAPSAVDAQSDVPHTYLRTVSMVCAAYSANVLENALAYLQHDLREQAINKAEEFMGNYSTWPFAYGHGKIEIPPGTELSLEVVAGALSVLAKMDIML